MQLTASLVDRLLVFLQPKMSTHLLTTDLYAHPCIQCLPFIPLSTGASGANNSVYISYCPEVGVSGHRFKQQLIALANLLIGQRYPVYFDEFALRKKSDDMVD